MQFQYSLKPSKLRHWRIAVFGVACALVIGLPAYWCLVGLRDVAKFTSDGYEKLDAKTLGNFDFNQTNGTEDDLPSRIRELDGRKVLLTGEMWAPSTADDASLNFFRLYGKIPDSSQQPLVQKSVDCTVPSGQKAYYYSGTVQVWGIFHVAIYKDTVSGAIKSLYQLDVEKVKPVD